jgi:hypothetical protein
LRRYFADCFNSVSGPPAGRGLSIRLRPPLAYISGMPSSKKPPKETLRSWRVSLLRSRAIPLGTVKAPDARAAEAAAVKQFGLDEEQRKRLAVREEE